MEITKDQIHLIDGEIYVTKDLDVNTKCALDLRAMQYGKIHRVLCLSSAKGFEGWLKTEEGVLLSPVWAKEITHSTADLEGVTKLDRSLFLKPKDVDTMAQEYLRQTLQVKLLSPFAERCCLTDFKAGYNANKGEFSRDEMEEAIFQAYNLGWERNYNIKEALSKEKIINSLRPLSIPESITINNNEVKVNWE